MTEEVFKIIPVNSLEFDKTGNTSPTHNQDMIDQAKSLRQSDLSVLAMALEIAKFTDQRIEVAQRTNLGIDELTADLLPTYLEILEADGVFLFCRGENLDFRIILDSRNSFQSMETLPEKLKSILRFVATCNGRRFKGRAMPSILEMPRDCSNSDSQNDLSCPGSTISFTDSAMVWDLVILDIDNIPVGVFGAWFQASTAETAGNRNGISSVSAMQRAAEIRVQAWNGPAEIHYPELSDSADRLFILKNFTEVMDNHIYSENISRLKQIVQNLLGSALKNRILNDGLTEALLILKEHIDFDSLLIMYHDEEDPELISLKYILYIEGKGLFDPYSNFDSEIHNLILRDGRDLLDGKTGSLRELVVLQGYQDEFLIAGLEKKKSIGKLLISSTETSFDRFERDLLEIFVSFVRQRVVDFNKEWRNLSKFFSVEHRTRLLSCTDYAERHLAPRDRNVAILYADIASFTMISEKILCDPFLISEMIDIWSKGCLSIIWEHGGCFDKLVGDCVIALFGPPFHEMSAEECCTRTLQAATAIRDFTLSLYNHPASCFTKLRESSEINSINVSTGVNYAPLFVGMNGPNSDFTGFSSGMNNTARIQSVARTGEILALSGCVINTSNIAGIQYEGPLEATLKNVSGKVPYWKLLTIPPKPSMNQSFKALLQSEEKK